MSTARFLSALVCTCTSAATALAAGSEQGLELALARRPALYLRLDVDRPELQVKVRGLELERIPVQSVVIAWDGADHPLAERPELQLPIVWRVADSPEADWRQVVAPPTLVPYSEEGLDQGPPISPTPEAERPSQYQVELAGGWVLQVGPSPPTGWWRRLADRLSAGWRRLWGKPVPPRQPMVAVVVAAEDARRLLHVFVKDLAILVVRGGDAAAAPATATPAPS